MRRRHFLLVFAALVFAALLALGNWQSRRAEEKEQLLTQYAAGRTATPRLVTDLSRLERMARFSRVRLSGEFDAAHVVLLDNQVHEGRVGIHVLAPLASGAGEAVLVNLGWLPLEDRSRLPDPPLPDGRTTLTGLINRPPEVGVRLGEPTRDGWPRLTPYLDMAGLDGAMEANLVNRVVLADPEPDGAYVRVWPVVSLPPSRHRAYAFQWYTLAAGFAAACAVVWWRYRGTRP